MDEKFLLEFGLAKANSLHMMASRGFIVRKPMEPMLEMSKLYTAAKQRGCSLAEAATESFGNAARKSVTTVFLDRNFDPARRKDKMMSTDQIKHALEKHGRDIVLIVPFKPSAMARKEVIGVELFTFDDLAINIPEHILYIPHTLDEHPDATQLPRIASSDPVVRWFGFPQDSVVRIDRPDGPTYRYVQ